MSDPDEFRRTVVAIATEHFPEAVILAPPTEYDFIMVDDKQVSLQNLRAACALCEDPAAELPELVRAHLAAVLSADSQSLENLSLEDAGPRLLPQVMPSTHVDQAPRPVVHFPLGREVRIGVVVDFPETYAYLRTEDVTRWGTSEQDMLQRAIANLEAASDGLDVQQGGENPDHFLAVVAGDGYAAARILVPSLRAFLASSLGESFRFAIPNRDFLICWRTDCSSEFHREIREMVRRDFEAQPYPLSASTFVVNSEGNFREDRDG